MKEDRRCFNLLPLHKQKYELIKLSSNQKILLKYPVKSWLSLLHLECSPACCGALRFPAVETAPPARAPGSVDSSSPLPLPPRAAWMTGDRMTLKELGNPTLPGCVLKETQPNQGPLTGIAHPARVAEALRADSSVGSL